MLLLQCFCLQGILPFSKSYRGIDQLLSAGEENLLTSDITLLFVERFV